MNITFRTDASIEIGTGHVMRCLTLADALRQEGAECHFICREHPGNLVELIKSKGHAVTVLPMTSSLPGVVGKGFSHFGQNLAHSHWLGASQAEDAEQTIDAMQRHFQNSGNSRTDWLVIDHYALDAHWEQELKPHYHKLMVIDDLADRQHLCDLLLDQTFGRKESDYKQWVPTDCKILCGAHYALLRPEFAQWRPYSLQRRQKPQLKNILVTMGGVDKDNVAGQVLTALNQAPLPAGCQIAVVMGATAPWLDTVRQQANTMIHPTTVLSGVSDMARLMADSDLAIGAAGATSWERCCLGLPTIMIILAVNQRKIGATLAQAGAAILLDSSNISTGLTQEVDGLLKINQSLGQMVENAQLVCDGGGTKRLVIEINRINEL